ncbi:MAG: hypothetical protein KZQ83_00385 [gamma proteobacterium symbiont of Taylorina sp.]|nr:hypothetical protein [gamma proteobacterium symbiont of Taylorina sp.]
MCTKFAQKFGEYFSPYEIACHYIEVEPQSIDIILADKIPDYEFEFQIIMSKFVEERHTTARFGNRLEIKNSDIPEYFVPVFSKEYICNWFAHYNKPCPKFFQLDNSTEQSNQESDNSNSKEDNTTIFDKNQLSAIKAFLIKCSLGAEYSGGKLVFNDKKIDGNKTMLHNALIEKHGELFDAIKSQTFGKYWKNTKKTNNNYKFTKSRSYTGRKNQKYRDEYYNNLLTSYKNNKPLL